MNIDCKWLEENFFKQRFSDEQKKLITEKMEVLNLEPGTVLVSQGDAGNAIYVVHSGTANIDCDLNGEHVRVGSAKTGDLVGEMSFLTGDEASATVTTRDACIIYKLPRDAFSALMKQDSELVYAIFAHLLTHTANVIRQMNAEKAAVQHYMAGNHF